MNAAAKTALSTLRSRGLLSFRAQPGDVKPKWRATAMGKAIFSSSLPTHQGEIMYKALESALGNLVLGEPLHLVYLILLDHPFEVEATCCKVPVSVLPPVQVPAMGKVLPESTF